MRLTDLEPRWLLREGKRIGFSFTCPLPNKQQWRQTCFFYPTARDEQMRSVAESMGVTSADDYAVACAVGKAHQLCKPECGWTLHVPPARSACTAPTAPPQLLDPEQASFESLTVTPSIDGSAGGNWHGFITNGEIK